MLVAFLVIAPALIQGITYSFDDAVSLLAAQARGSFNTTEPLIILLQPGVYALPGGIAITAPSLELHGASELRCQTSGSALMINVPGSVLISGLNITMCSGPTPAVTVAQSSNVTLDQLTLRSNSAGALNITANTSTINLYACSFEYNSLQSLSTSAADTHAASISLGQGSVSMHLVTSSSNGIGSPAAYASIMLVSCTNLDPSSCSFNSTNSSWVRNVAGSWAPVVAIRGFGSVKLYGTELESNMGSSTLSVIPLIQAATSWASTGTPPSSPGRYNVILSGARVTGNQGTLYGGVHLLSCGSVLIEGSTFVGNGPASLGPSLDTVSQWSILLHFANSKDSLL